MANKFEVIIYTDGACSGNPGPGGWAAILLCKNHEKEIAGFNERTTNNRMEMTAVIEALCALKNPCDVEIHTDSALIVGAINDWLNKWAANGWRKADKKPVENTDLWQEYLRVAKPHHVIAIKVAGHTNDEMNNRADHLAVEQSRLARARYDARNNVEY